MMRRLRSLANLDFAKITESSFFYQILPDVTLPNLA